MRLSTYIGFHESTFYYCFFRLNSRYSTFLFLIKKKIVELPHTQVVECSKKPSSCYLHVLKHNEKIISVANVIDLKWMLKSFFKMHRSKYRYMYEECSRPSQNVISEWYYTFCSFFFSEFVTPVTILIFTIKNRKGPVYVYFSLEAKYKCS